MTFKMAMAGYIVGFPNWDTQIVYRNDQGAYFVALREKNEISNFIPITLSQDTELKYFSYDKHDTIGDPFKYLFLIGGKPNLFTCGAIGIASDIFQNKNIDPFLKLTIFERLNYESLIWNLVILRQCLSVIEKNYGERAKLIFQEILLERRLFDKRNFFSFRKIPRDLEVHFTAPSILPDKYISPSEWRKGSGVSVLKKELGLMLEQPKAPGQDQALLNFSNKILEEARAEMFSSYSSLVVSYLKKLKKYFGFVPRSKILLLNDLDLSKVEDLIFSLCIDSVSSAPQKQSAGQKVFDLIQVEDNARIKSNLLYLLEINLPKNELNSRLQYLLQKALDEGDDKFSRQLFRKIKY